MSLKGSVTLVHGGLGIVGSGIASALIQNGAKCWVTTRGTSQNDERLELLKKSISPEFHSNLSLFKGDLMNESDATRLKDEILAKDGQLNHVVSTIGGWRTDGKLSKLTVEQFKKVLMDYTIPHFVCYKTFASLLAETNKSTFTFITGGSCEAKMFDPNASLLPVSTGAQMGMFTSANSEHARHKNLAIIELRVFSWVRRELDAKFEKKKAELEVGNDYVGKFIPKLILKHKSDVYKIQGRTIGDKLFSQL